MQALKNELKHVQTTKAWRKSNAPEYLKTSINEFLWSNLPGAISLEDADDLACALLSVIEQLYDGTSLEDIANGTLRALK